MCMKVFVYDAFSFPARAHASCSMNTRRIHTRGTHGSCRCVCFLQHVCWKLSAVRVYPVMTSLLHCHFGSKEGPSPSRALSNSPVAKVIRESPIASSLWSSPRQEALQQRRSLRSSPSLQSSQVLPVSKKPRMTRHLILRLSRRAAKIRLL